MKTISFFVLGYLTIGLIVALFYVKMYGDEFADHLMSNSDEFKDDTEEQTLLSIFIVALLVWPVFIEEFFNQH